MRCGMQLPIFPRPRNAITGSPLCHAADIIFPAKFCFFLKYSIFFCRLSTRPAIFSSSYQPLKSNRPQSPCFGVSSTLFNQSYFANERWRADFLNPLDGLIETERNLQINVFSNWRVRRFQNKTAPYFVRLFGAGSLYSSKSLP